MKRPLITVSQLCDLMGVKSSDPALTQRLDTLGLDYSQRSVDEHLASTEAKSLGLEVSFKDEAMIHPEKHQAFTGVWVVVGAHLHSSNHEGFSQYMGELPLGVLFTEDRDQIHLRLGSPNKSGGGNAGPGKRVWPSWDMYNLRPDIFVRYQYGGNGALQLVTIYIA